MRRGLAITLVLAALPLAAVRADTKLPPALRDVGITQRLNEQVPLALTFRDETGRPVRLREYFEGRPVILVLAYYRCPRLCTRVLNALAESLHTLAGQGYTAGREFRVLTVSFDPDETPALARAKKQAYVDQYGVSGAGWHFLTGSRPAIRRLADAVGFRYAWDAERQQYAHASGIMLLTPEGKVARYFFGLQYNPRDLRFGLIEASHNEIGKPVDRALLLFCYSYDAASGTYQLSVLNLVRLGGVLTVLLIVFFLVRAWRRERRQDRQDLAAAG
jgi:protein SCO1/2